MKKSILFVAMILVSIGYSYGQHITPRVYDNLNWLQYDSKSDKTLQPYGVIKYIMTKQTSNGYINYYIVKEDDRPNSYKMAVYLFIRADDKKYYFSLPINYQDEVINDMVGKNMDKIPNKIILLAYKESISFLLGLKK